jgi:hypothetical protein
VAVGKKEGVEFGTVPRDIPCDQFEMYRERNFTPHILVSQLHRRLEDKTSSSLAEEECSLTDSAKVAAGRFLVMNYTGVFILFSLLLDR